MLSDTKPYRPHNPGHDYYGRGVYLITLVTRERKPLLGRLGNDITNPIVHLSDTGKIIMDEWQRTEAIQQKQGRQIRLLAQVVMPDHWHGVVEVCENMDKSLGAIIQAVKSACTHRWWEMTGQVESPSSAALIKHLSTKQRAEYYATHAEAKPLFDPNYDDTICLDERHREAMVRYVEDNPRRAIIRKMHPDFMQRRLHVWIGEREYAAFGNLFLLRWPRKLQVFCHRKARYGQLSEEEKAGVVISGQVSDTYTTNIPYIQTIAFQKEHDEWHRMLKEGATVIVTPGISPGEVHMKNECLTEHLPLIHIQKEPIGSLWKPEKSRFEACEHGTLLILAPWTVEGDTDYLRFHNLNDMAAEICAFQGNAHIRL